MGSASSGRRTAPAAMKVSAASLIPLYVFTAVCGSTNAQSCVRSADCRADEACMEQGCGNPCLDICGQHATCQVVEHNPVCDCPAGYTGDPFVRCTPTRTEGGDSCSLTSQCSRSKKCNKITSACEDVCVANACGENAHCHADHHVPICNCISGYTGDPKRGCYPMQDSVMCPPLIDPSRGIYCTFQGRDADCQTQMAPGTKAFVLCKPHFENVPALRSFDMTCRENGTWSRALQACVPICGEQNAHGVPLLAYGVPSKIAEYPWHVALYRSTRDGLFNLICGGTLVSTRVVVTAAHCFPDDVATQINQFRAVAGKFQRDWNKNTKFTQHLNIEKIVQHSNYRGRDRNYVNDIAVIILKFQIRVDQAVRPICVDYDKFYKRYFSPDIVGKVVGFGNTENQEMSDVLLTGNLTYVKQAECEKESPASFHDLLIGEKFCAGGEKTYACRGDSGGGYSVQFPRSTRWYLVGVVSVAPSEECAEYPYAAFTAVYSYLEFIRDYVYA